MRSGRQARSKVLKFGGAKYIFTGHIFVFILFFKDIFLGTRKFGWHKRNLGGTAPQCPPWLRAWYAKGLQKVVRWSLDADDYPHSHQNPITFWPIYVP